MAFLNLIPHEGFFPLKYLNNSKKKMDRKNSVFGEFYIIYRRHEKSFHI